MLESVSEIFELDIGWRVCCSRISVVNDDGCFCDGAVNAALEVTARSNIHARVMDAIPGACGFQLTSAESCPTAIFADSEDDDKLNVTTSDPTRELVSIHADVYTAPEVISSVTAAGAVVVSSTDASRDDAEVADNVAAEGLGANFDADTGLVTLTLPGDATVTADVAVFYPNGIKPSFVSSPPPGPIAAEAVAIDPEDPRRPLPGYGVVMSDGRVVPALEIEDDTVTGPCDAVRMLKNFLTVSLEPGMESFVVMGAITHCKGFPLEVPQVVLPIMYRPGRRRRLRAAALRTEGGVPRDHAHLQPGRGAQRRPLRSFLVRGQGLRRGRDHPRRVHIVDCALTGRASDGAIAGCRARDRHARGDAAGRDRDDVRRRRRRRGGSTPTFARVAFARPKAAPVPRRAVRPDGGE